MSDARILYATQLDPKTGAPAPWETAPKKVSLGEAGPGWVEITAHTYNMTPITYSEHPTLLGMAPELDPGATDTFWAEGDFWIRAPWTSAWAASAVRVAAPKIHRPPRRLGSNFKSGPLKTIPRDGSAIIVGGAIGQMALRVMRPKESLSTIRVYGGTHLVMKNADGTPASDGGKEGLFPDLTTQGAWELHPGVMLELPYFNGTFFVWAPGGYKADQALQKIMWAKMGVAAFYGPPPVEP